MKALLLILTFFTFSTCVPLTHTRNFRVVNPTVPVAVVNTQPIFYPYYGYSQVVSVRPPYMVNVYHKPRKNITVLRGGRRR